MSAVVKRRQRTHAFILAGGQGERLLPLTISRPKPLVSFGGIFRIIDFTLLNCLNSALSRVSVLTQHKYQDVHTYIRKTWSELWKNSTGRGSSRLQCLEPSSGKRYRGTADAVFHNLSILDADRPEFVLILSGDHIYDMDYRCLVGRHADTRADLTIATVECPVEAASHFGVVEVTSGFKVAGFQEKPANPRPLPGRPSTALVNMGVYVFKTDVLAQALHEYCDTGRGYDFGHDIIPSLIQSGRVFAYDFRDENHGKPRYWRDIGTLDSYYQASMDLVQPHPPFNPYIKDASRSRPLAPITVSLAGKAHVARSVLSPGVRIEQGAFVEDCVLMPGVHVGKNASLLRAVVDEGVTIPAGFRAGFDARQDGARYIVTETGVVVVSDTGTTNETVPRPAERVIDLAAHRSFFGNDSEVPTFS